MADPVTIALIAGTVIAAGGQVVGGIQQSKAAAYQAKAYEAEAVTQKQAAEYAEKQHRENISRFIGTQRARYGASGVDVSAGGSVKAVLADTVIQGEKDALSIRYGGDVAAILARNRARMAKWEGGNAMTSGIIGAGSTLLSGAGTAYQLHLKSK